MTLITYFIIGFIIATIQLAIDVKTPRVVEDLTDSNSYKLMVALLCFVWIINVFSWPFSIAWIAAKRFIIPKPTRI